MIPYFEITYFSIGPVKIHTWGLFVGLAFCAGYFWLLWQGRKNGLVEGKIIGLVLCVFFGAALGSRALFLLQEPRKWLADMSLLWRMDAGGLMLWGGILGGILAGWLYMGWVKSPLAPLYEKGEKKKDVYERGEKNDFWQIADLATPVLALGLAIGRIGCFLVNDHQGSPTNLPWGILWPDGIIRHPVALYEILFGLVMFGVLWQISKQFGSVIAAKTAVDSGIVKQGIYLQPRLVSRRALKAIIKQISGRACLPAGRAPTHFCWRLPRPFIIFLFSYSIFRFFLDFLRATDGPLADPRWAWGLTTSQWICLAVMLFIVIYYAGQKMLKLDQ